MALGNSPRSFGGISRTLHWGMALAILGMLALGMTLTRMQPSLANLWLYGLHKSVGVVLLIAWGLRLVWHRVSPVPAPIAAGVAAWQLRAARAVHIALYLLMGGLPVTGLIGSAATGIDTVIFNRWTLPPLVAPSETLEHLFLGLHHWLAWTLVACLVLHVAGALDRHIRKQDATLWRMLTGRHA